MLSLSTFSRISPRISNQPLITILEIRGVILQRGDNMDQIDPAEFADVTIVRGDEQPSTTNYSGDRRGDS